MPATQSSLVIKYRGRSRGGGGWGVMWVSPPPPHPPPLPPACSLLGDPKLQEEGITSHACAQMQHVLVLSSYPDPLISGILYLPLEYQEENCHIGSKKGHSHAIPFSGSSKTSHFCGHMCNIIFPLWNLAVL